ncbi:MAG: VanZ family protein [Vicinamibacterales bacterium]
MTDSVHGKALLSRWLPVVAVMAAIFMLSAQPALPDVGVSDKQAHGLTYGALAVLVLRALARARWSGVSMGSALSSAVVATLYGVSDEWHQSFVPGRSSDVRDVVADAVGALIAVLAVWLWSILATRRDAH